MEEHDTPQQVAVDQQRRVRELRHICDDMLAEVRHLQAMLGMSAEQRISARSPGRDDSDEHDNQDDTSIELDDDPIGVRIP